MRGWLAATATAVLTVGVLGVGYAMQRDASAPPACPRVTAHRSAMSYAPENTVAGIIAAGGLGVPAVELDVRFSKSHFPVLMHDETVDRTTTGTGRPHDLGLGALTALLAQDYAPWKTMPAYAGVHVPYAWEFLDAAQAADLDLLLDIVGDSAPDSYDIDKLAEYVGRFDYADRTVFMGPEVTVKAMRARQPSWRYALIEYNPATTIRRGESLVGLGVEAYAVPARDITPAAVAYWHSYGVRVLTWTSDTAAIDVPATWRRVAAAGVDELITNDPPAAIAVLADTCVGPSAGASTS